MLAADGHRIIHSTRHSPLEFGKDVITVDQEGRACAYQLKGQPSGRLTHSDFRNIKPQIDELVELPISDQSVPKRQHKSFLVTNGLIEEETRLVVADLNSGWKKNGYPDRHLELIQRGDILDMAKRLGYSLWPTELENVGTLIQLLAESGKGLPPFAHLDDLLRPLLHLNVPDRKTSAADLKRRITSAALLVSVATKNHQRMDNHYAIFAAWMQFCAYSIAACERHSVSFRRNAEVAVGIASTAMKDSLIDLALEIIDRKALAEGDIITDFVVYRARYTLVLGLLSLLWFWCDETSWPDNLDRDKLTTFLKNGKKYVYTWGEAVIPQLLSYCWFLSEADTENEDLLELIIGSIMRSDADDEIHGLPSPYFNFEDVARHTLAPMIGMVDDPLRNEYSGGSSFYLEPLMHLLVRTNRKLSCKLIWPKVTRMRFMHFVPRYPWQYCLWRVKEEIGRYENVGPTWPKQWSDLKKEARSVSYGSIPKQLASDRMLLAFFLLAFPHRATPEVIRYLGWKFDRTWFLDPPIDVPV
jgi:hypothetical protein